MTLGSASISRSKASMVSWRLNNTCDSLRIDKETIGVRTPQAAKYWISCVRHPFQPRQAVGEPHIVYGAYRAPSLGYMALKEPGDEEVECQDGGPGRGYLNIFGMLGGHLNLHG